MQGKLVPIKLPPGIYRNGTKYQTQARWYGGNLVRFIDGTIRPIGGWRTAEAAAGGPLGALTGVARGAIAWRSSSGAVRIGVGTHTKAYVIAEGTSHDITPAGFTTGDQDSVYSGGTGTYGSGVYGSGVYGTGSIALVIDEADTWQLDTFGDYLVGVFTEDGKLYYWDGNTLNDFVQATDSPTQNRGVMVTHERFLVALGASNNVRQIKWATQEGGISVAGNWTPSGSNTAGDWSLETRGRIMAGRRTKNENLIWTDVDLHRMRYIGGVLVYAFEQVGDSCGLIAPNAVSIVESRAFWMGRDNFFMYDGFVRPLPSEVRDYVFGDFNAVQAAKVWSLPISKYGEVWWFYPSAGATEIDRYVVFNYIEGHWSIGTLSRTAGFDMGATPFPTMIESNGTVQEHETGDDRGSEVPHLESGPFELAEGDRIMSILAVVPDEKTAGDVNATLYTAFFPNGTETANGPYTLASPTDVRLKARQVRVRLDQVREVDWRVGILRLAVQPAGKR